MCVCVCVCVCVLVCMVGVIYVYVDTIFFLKLLSWMLQHDCLDTCCFGCLICMCFDKREEEDVHVFCIFIFAPVQRN